MTRRMSPEEVRKAAAYALEHLPCEACGTAAGEPCPDQGRGRSVCGARYVTASIALRQEIRAAQQTPEQAGCLAGLPRVPPEEIQDARSPRGGWTRETLARWGVPWPPPAGWRRALERGEHTKGQER